MNRADVNQARQRLERLVQAVLELFAAGRAAGSSPQRCVQARDPLRERVDLPHAVAHAAIRVAPRLIQPADHVLEAARERIGLRHRRLALDRGRRIGREPPKRIEEGIERRVERLTRFPERGLDYCERLRDGLLALLGGTLLLQTPLESIVAHRAEACDLDAPARAQFFVPAESPQTAHCGANTPAY